MRLNHSEIQRLARERGMSLSAVLERAGVSRTAYYSLARRSSVLPQTIRLLSRALDVPELGLLEQVPSRVIEAREVCEREPEATFDNVWHVLTLLELPPVERLNRSLTRGRAVTVHG